MAPSSLSSYSIFEKPSSTSTTCTSNTTSNSIKLVPMTVLTSYERRCGATSKRSGAGSDHHHAAPASGGTGESVSTSDASFDSALPDSAQELSLVGKHNNGCRAVSAPKFAPYRYNNPEDHPRLRSKRDAAKYLKELEHARNPELVEVVEDQKCKRCARNGWRCFIERNANSPRKVCRPCGKNKCSFGNATGRPETHPPPVGLLEAGSKDRTSPLLIRDAYTLPPLLLGGARSGSPSASLQPRHVTLPPIHTASSPVPSLASQHDTPIRSMSPQEVTVETPSPEPPSRAHLRRATSEAYVTRESSLEALAEASEQHAQYHKHITLTPPLGDAERGRERDYYKDGGEDREHETSGYSTARRNPYPTPGPSHTPGSSSSHALVPSPYHRSRFSYFDGMDLGRDDVWSGLVADMARSVVHPRDRHTVLTIMNDMYLRNEDHWRRRDSGHRSFSDSMYSR